MDDRHAARPRDVGGQAGVDGLHLARRVVELRQLPAPGPAAELAVDEAVRLAEIAEAARHGIERVPADVFLWGGYRYSNARDALAAAKRGVKQ